MPEDLELKLKRRHMLVITFEVFCEASSGNGRIDIFLKHKKDITIAPIFLELKYTTVKNSDSVEQEKKKAIIQAESYIVDIAPEFDSEKVVIAAAVYVKGTGYYPTNIDVYAGGRSNTVANFPVQCATMTKRIERSLLCWDEQNIDEGSNKDVDDEVASQLRNGFKVNGDSLVQYLKYKDPIFQSQMIEYYKKLKYHDIPESDLRESPCANKLPATCVDKFNNDLIDKTESKEIISHVKGINNLVVSNSLLEDFGNSVDKLMAVDTLNKILLAIKEIDFKSISKIAGLTVLSHYLAPKIGNVLENAYRKQVTISMIDAIDKAESKEIISRVYYYYVAVSIYYVGVSASSLDLS
ncbi:PD-(D/E)XK nuclease superfamily domain-containing protein [Ditylenchus destructor]|nr:PD-(D/E)XK nuclease superfamily domain-containing protein [Ditylenchus destructor]